MTDSLIAPQPEASEAPAPGESLLSQDKPEAAPTEPGQPGAQAAEQQAAVAYEPFQLPQGVDIDPSALEKAQSLFAEARLSQPQAQKLVDLYAGKMNELVQRQIATQISAAQSRQTAWVAEVKNDPELGGRRFEQARAAAQRALNRFGTPELRRTLDELWVGNNPQLFRFFVRVGQAASEDTWTDSRSAATRVSAAQTLYPRQNNDQNNNQE